ncbi:MAG: ABC-type branched-chain amino acid transport system, ATPase component, partial [Frankiales bacterium]|nr:ABC-type branched-chain amino acid transport system, ATPase component [Frankiales bacterium]
AAARETLGITGRQESPALRPVLKEHGLSIYPLTAIGALGVVDIFQAQAFNILTPEVSRALGLGLGAIGAARTLAFLATILSPLPMAALAQKRGRMALLCVTTGVVWSVITLTTGFVTSLIALLAVLVFDGLSTGSVLALHPPFITNSYPPTARVRVLAIYQSFVVLGQVLAPLFVSLLTGPFDLTWRGVFFFMGLTSLATSLYGIALRDPRPGQFDTELLREDEHERVAHDEALSSDEVALGFFEIVRRLLLIPTIQRIAVGYFAFGILVIPFLTFLSAFLAQRWGLSPAQRGLFFAGINIVGIVALIFYGSRTEKSFAKDPSKVLGQVGFFLMAAVACIALAGVMPIFVLTCVFFAAGQSLIAVLSPGLAASTLSIVDARYRPHAAALAGIFTAGGSLLGILLLSSVNDRYGTTGSMVALAFPGVAAGLIMRSARKLINKDLDRMIDEVLESEDIRVIKQRGGKLPMLQAKGVDFSYGQLQVLFDVDFTVDDGEMVALLGTNGAGKSTLLKVISGIGLPSNGTVRYRGEDITYLDAERRVPLGITQVPGGRAVFGTMDVVENLRTFAFTLGRDKKKIDALVDECFEAFPRLYERRTSLAATMSGGEQQMLGLSKALILQPKLLLIDELSLGLAPVIVGQLLEMVRKINQTGTAVVLVEQSVNIALSLVDHAYFMEKGEMRFDGPAQQLLERDDLLRAVFLEGASKAEGK